ncbi:hypothetical protein MSPP1_002864 [Malassezia sp. CBS 17886]|nr:hypothetical protein MSPP1_002864 [Malassezia sp. CBS 17886]
MGRRGKERTAHAVCALTRAPSADMGAVHWLHATVCGPGAPDAAAAYAGRLQHRLATAAPRGAVGILDTLLQQIACRPMCVASEDGDRAAVWVFCAGAPPTVDDARLQVADRAASAHTSAERRYVRCAGGILLLPPVPPRRDTALGRLCDTRLRARAAECTVLLRFSAHVVADVVVVQTRTEAVGWTPLDLRAGDAMPAADADAGRSVLLLPSLQRAAYTAVGPAGDAPSAAQLDDALAAARVQVRAQPRSPALQVCVEVPSPPAALAQQPDMQLRTTSPAAAAPFQPTPSPSPAPPHTPLHALALDSPPIAHKYNVHGKFYARTDHVPMKRPLNSDGERRELHLLSPRSLHEDTLQSAACSVPSTRAHERDERLDAQCDDDADDVGDACTRAALLLRRLHTSAWPQPAAESTRHADGRADDAGRVCLAWAARGCGCRPPRSTAPHAAPMFTRRFPLHTLAPPQFVVSHGGAMAEVCQSALPFWTALGLGPAGGAKTVRAHVVLAGRCADEVDTAAVRTWLQRLGSAFQQRRLGTHDGAAVFRERGGILQGPERGREAQAGAWDTFSRPLPPHTSPVLYLVYGADEQSLRDAESLADAWADGPGAVVPVCAAEIVGLAGDCAALAHRAYADARCAADGDAPAAPSVLLAPTNYARCRHLVQRAALRVQWPHPPRAVLRAGMVLNVAYDMQHAADGTVRVRVVSVDERGRHTVTHATAVPHGGTDAAVTHVWQHVHAQLRTAESVAWHVLVVRAGAMPRAELRAWAAMASDGRLRVGSANSLPPSLLPAGVAAAAVYLPERMPVPQGLAVGTPVPMLALASAYIARVRINGRTDVSPGDARTEDAWALHLLLVSRSDGQATSGLGRPRTHDSDRAPVDDDLATANEYLRDAVAHLHALQGYAEVQTAGRCWRPWPIVVLGEGR